MNIKLLTFTTLYPDSTRPTHGIFVENRLRHLLAGSGNVQSRVVAPVPWFPSAGQVFGYYGRFARVPKHERRHGISVVHPRYPLVPKLGMTAAPWLMALAVRGTIRKLIADGYDFDLIDAHYFYPDGVAAAILGRTLGKPLVITARGTDLNLIPQYFFPRKMIQWAAGNASALIAVSESLRMVLHSLGVSGEKVAVLRNGVDLAQFKPPQDRDALRRRLGLSGRTLLSVGNLIPLKGHEFVIRALTYLPGTTLMIAGEGAEQKRLQRIADLVGVASRVRFLGHIAHELLSDFYGASDVLVLASNREGWPNVLLESLACGTPAICTRVGCVPELLSKPEAGLILERCSSEGIAQSIETLMARNPDRVATRRYAERFSWDDTTLGQIQLFEKVLGLSKEQARKAFSTHDELTCINNN